MNETMIRNTERDKVRFATAIQNSSRCVLVGELARLIRTPNGPLSAKELFAQLRADGYLRDDAMFNFPTRKSNELSLFEVRQKVRVHKDGRVSVTKTTVVTGNGQIYFFNKYSK